jgi:hypothetical protein
MEKIDQQTLTDHIVKKIANMNLEVSPFTVFTSDNILPTKVFESLRSSFPVNNFHYNQREGYSTQGMQDVDLKVLSKVDPIWNVFISSITSQQFLTSLKLRLAPQLRKELGLIAYLPWSISTKEHKNSKLRWNLEFFPSLKIHSYSNGGILNPHKDARRKAMTLIFYFADDDWKKDWGGDTLFFRFKSEKHKKIWKRQKWHHKNSVPKENLEEFYDLFEVNLKAEYKANSLSGMSPNDYSYHAVSPINIDKTRQRKTVILTFELEKKFTVYRRIKHLYQALIQKIIYR